MNNAPDYDELDTTVQVAIELFHLRDFEPGDLVDMESAKSAYNRSDTAGRFNLLTLAANHMEEIAKSCRSSMVLKKT